MGRSEASSSATAEGTNERSSGSSIPRNELAREISEGEREMEGEWSGDAEERVTKVGVAPPCWYCCVREKDVANACSPAGACACVVVRRSGMLLIAGGPREDGWTLRPLDGLVGMAELALRLGVAPCLLCLLASSVSVSIAVFFDAPSFLASQSMMGFPERSRRAVLSGPDALRWNGSGPARACGMMLRVTPG
jgi:hypothetical protein